MPDSFLVIGAGQIGVPLAARLASLGYSVKIGSRTKPARLPSGVDHLVLDATDGPAVAKAAAGTRAVILAINPPLYDADAGPRRCPPRRPASSRAQAPQGRGWWSSRTCISARSTTGY